MESSEEILLKNNEVKKETITSLLEQHKSQDVWISDEEFYTEGSSDEDDMALRIKQRERRKAKREESSGTTAPLNESRLVNNKKDTEAAKNIPADQNCDESHLWRPTYGTNKLKTTLDPDHGQLPTGSKQPDVSAK